MSELKQHARKFPAVDVIYSDGIKSKLPIVFDASGVDASKLAVSEASLAMVDSWSKPFYDAFSESKSVRLYEVLYFCYLTFHSFLACVASFIDSWLLCLNPIK
ncbi:Phosphopantetheine adenylyltransferase [Gossypium australe]|uniref:Phosphopantetheine adenylyltransferase n=1 Tax=Gossypium australe TaxID=47621 RepID=A0A5B6WQU8_9ROSI|nr:Phosphopantetheine adenylyltransferase [Gossypium australe]